MRLDDFATWSFPPVRSWGNNDRGVSFTFGADIIEKFLDRHDLDLICRAHQARGQLHGGPTATFVNEKRRPRPRQEEMMIETRNS